MTAPATRPTGGRRRQTVAAAVIVALGTALVAGISFGLTQANRSLRSSPPIASSSGPRSASPPAVSSMPDSQSYLDAALPSKPADPLGPTTLHPVWTVDGGWWAALLEPATGQTRIHRLSVDGSALTDTGRVVDERPDAVADTVWAGGHLYVATVVRDRAVGSGVRLSRYSPDPATGFKPDPDFPVQLTDRGVRAMSLARDGRGRLWLAIVRDGVLEVAHSTTNDANWTTPAALSGAGTVGNDDVVAIVAFGPGRLGLVWSSSATNAVWFAARPDADPPESWSAAEDVSTGMPLLRDPIAAAAGPDGSVLVSVAGDVRGSSTSPDTPRLVVARRDSGGAWSATVAGRVVDRHGPSAIVPSGDGGEIDLLASQASAGTAWVLKRSSPSRLEFEAGPGTPLAAPVGIATQDLSGPHVAAEPSATGDVLVLGFDGTIGRYVHTLIRSTPAEPGPSATPSGSPGPSGNPAPSASLPPPGGPVAPLPLAVVDDTFDVFEAGVTAPNGWLPRTGDPAANVVVAAASGHGSVLSLRSTAAADVRACKSFSAVSGGTLTATVLVRLDRLGTSDATITSLRLHGNEAALVRFGSGGTFAYYAGASKIRTTVAWKPGTWYESTVRVDLAKHTYSWQLGLPGAKAPLVRAAKIPFRDPTATEIDSICLQTSSGGAGLGLTVDRVVVTR